MPALQTPITPITRSFDVDVIAIATSGPGDVSGLVAHLASGRIAAADIVAVIGKTEGNGCVNDFTREYATSALAGLLARHLGLTVGEVEQRVAFVMSGGTEGVLAPHCTVFTRRPSTVQRRPAGRMRLSIGTAFTRDFEADEIGRRAQIVETAAAVKRAMQAADIESAADLHFVQIKCPLLTSGQIAAARACGQSLVTTDTYESMACSRGASALGVALATGEIDLADVSEGAVLRDWALASSTASASSGIELQHNVVVVLGMSRQSDSAFEIAHEVMADAIDAGAVQRALTLLGLSCAAEVAARVVGVFAKSEASPDGQLRGERHTMLNDSDIHSTRHARAAVGVVLASIVGHGRLYVSGGAEHQGPPGGGPVAVIARCRESADPV